MLTPCTYKGLYIMSTLLTTANKTSDEHLHRVSDYSIMTHAYNTVHYITDLTIVYHGWLKEAHNNNSIIIILFREMITSLYQVHLYYVTMGNRHVTNPISHSDSFSLFRPPG